MTIFKKKVTLLADGFPSLQTSKKVVRYMSKKSCFRRPFEKEHGKRAQRLFKSEWENLYDIYWSLWRQLSWKKSFLVIYKILGFFVYTLIADDKYSLLNRDNLTEPTQMQLCYKQKTFSSLFTAFLKSILTCEHFREKCYLHRWCISELADSEKCG